MNVDLLLCLLKTKTSLKAEAELKPRLLGWTVEYPFRTTLLVPGVRTSVKQMQIQDVTLSIYQLYINKF